MAVKEGDTVKVDYTGSFEDGTVFDTSEKHGAPLEFKTGENMVVPGFEKAIIEMKKGEEKEITLPPSEGYGDKNPELIQKVPKKNLPTGEELKVGTMLIMSLPNGQELPVKIVELNDKEATVDMNHPLAGKTLKFKIKLVDIVAS
jgi:FKBP-type peptidyl-prolyl cis-trans isomerase 2